MSSSGKNEREVVRCVIKDDTRGLEAFVMDERRINAKIKEKRFMKENKIGAVI